MGFLSRLGRVVESVGLAMQSRRRDDAQHAATIVAACTLLCMVLLSGRPALAQAGAWTMKAPMPTARQDLAAGALGGLMYAVGGRKVGPRDIIYSTVEAYDPATDTWATESPLPTPCFGGGAAAVGAYLYYVGCGHTYAYDAATNKWSTRAALPAPPLLSSLVVGAGGKLYVIGGYTIGIFSDAAYSVVEAYDPKTDEWTARSPLPVAACCMSGGTIDGTIFVAGGVQILGRYQDRVLATLLAYDPNTDSWSAKTSMPEDNAGSTSGVIGGRLYVIGGNSGPSFDYDPRTDSWRTVTPDPYGGHSAAAGAVGDVLYVVGGYSADVLAVNEAFSPFEKVGIDIRAGDPNDTINLKSGGVVPVAILGSATFDPKTVDPSTVTFAGAPVATRGRGVAMTTLADMNHDGYPDLVLFFRTQDMTALAGASAGSSVEAVLYGKTYSGTPIRGSGTVRILKPDRH